MRELHTKADFKQLLLRLVDPLKPHYSLGNARLHLGNTATHYDPVAAEMEAFARPLWGLAPLWANDGDDVCFSDLYRHGVVNGTTPEHPEYWGGFVRYDQRFVEMAAISCAILLAPQTLWEPLSKNEKANVAAWLNGINQQELPVGNWHFFRVLTNTALNKLGCQNSRENTEESLAILESHYLGDGWYQDGNSGHRDYYISFAYHFYGLIYSRFMEHEDEARCAVFRERAVLFAQDFIYWFSDDGSAIPFGRSLTYRFAQASFWSACLFAGVYPFSVARIKGIITRHLCYWIKQPIFERDGVLTIGYAYPSLIMSESYNAPGSPYWSLKSFLLLALPDEHPFWQAFAEPLPVLSEQRYLKKANMLIRRNTADVTAYVPGIFSKPGHGCTAEKYAKFAYSTKFGFSAARSNQYLHEAAPDSMLAFVIDGSEVVFTRHTSDEFQLDERMVYSVWSPFPGISVKTTIIPTTTGHKRRHEVQSLYDCHAYDCGYGIKAFCEGFCSVVDGNTAMVENASGGCSVRGKGSACEPYVFESSPNTHLLHPIVEIPAARYRIAKGFSELETEVVTW